MKFPFGKYKGKTPEEAMRGYDFSYILWWNKTIKNYPIPKEIVNQAYNKHYAGLEKERERKRRERIYEAHCRNILGYDMDKENIDEVFLITNYDNVIYPGHDAGW